MAGILHAGILALSAVVLYGGKMCAILDPLMNLFHAMIPNILRRTLSAATAAGALLSASCTVFPPPAFQPGPPFTPDGRPRYGHNGTDSPYYGNPEARAIPRNSGQPDIRRDPNNTRVDITPPEPRNSPDTGYRTGVNPDSNPPSMTTPDPTPPPTVKPREELLYGIPVVGKRGLVYSPHAPEKGQVDVEGLKRGTRVKCPYTGLDFRVP